MNVQDGEKPSGGDPPRLAPVLLAWLLLFGLAGARVASTWREFSATIDEGRHVAAAVELYQTRAYTVYFGNPPLPRWFTGWLPYRRGARVPEGDVEAALAPYLPVVHGDREHATGKYVLEEAPDYWDTLAGARAGNLVFLALLLAFVYRWSADLHGRVAGLVSTAIVSSAPLVLGHGGLATTDLPATAMSVVACYALWRWALAPGLGRAAWAGLAVGLAVATKITIPPFLVLSGAGLFALVRGRALLERDTWRLPVLRRAAAQLVLVGLVAFLALWGSYLFEAHPWIERSPWLADAIDRRFAPNSWLNRVARFVAREVPLPLDVLPDGIRIAKQETGRAWPAYLFGEIHPGLYRYFVVGLGLKATLGFLALLPLTMWALLRRGKRAAGTVGVLGVAFVFLLGPSLSLMNIGVRHVMPVVAFLSIAYGLSFGHDSSRALRGLGALLLVAHLAEGLRTHPDYLAHLNPIGRHWKERHGRPPLLDSNVDWGQDVARLARWCRENGIREIDLSVFGTRYSTSPAALGMTGARLLEPGRRPTGWFAVSYDHLVGIGLSVPDYEAFERFRWLEGREPAARIGASILVYDLRPRTEGTPR